MRISSCVLVVLAASAGGAAANTGPFGPEHRGMRRSDDQNPRAGQLTLAGKSIDDSQDRVTAELGLGVGLTRLREDGADPTSQPATSIALGVGWQRGANAATLRIATGWFHRDRMTTTDPLTAGAFVGPAGQHWFAGRAFVGAGLGVLALVDDAAWTADPGGDLRAGVALARLGGATFTASAEATVGILETGPATHVSIQLGVQRW